MRGCLWNCINRRSHWGGCSKQQRLLLHEGPDTLEELLDRHLVHQNNKSNDEFHNTSQLTSTRREALSLYRDIIRATRFFNWPDSSGVLWRDVLRYNARSEFEQARFETDPQIVTRLLIGGRQALHSAIDKLADKHTQHIHKHNPSHSHQP